MLPALMTLLTYRLIGEVLVVLTRVPLPGIRGRHAFPLSVLSARCELPSALRDTANGVLPHRSLLFVPAGVGVMPHYARVAEELPTFVVCAVASTMLAIATIAWVGS